MNLSKTSKYALRILGYMAKDERALYSAQQLHEKIDVPERYLRRILTDLAKLGFLKSIQGRQGGFTFNRSITGIYLIEIVDAVDGRHSIDTCILGYETCAFNHSCPMHDVWEVAKQATIKTLSETTLNDIREAKINVN